jgi:hypothetical protein
MGKLFFAHSVLWFAFAYFSYDNGNYMLSVFWFLSLCLNLAWWRAYAEQRQPTNEREGE